MLGTCITFCVHILPYLNNDSEFLFHLNKLKIDCFDRFIFLGSFGMCKPVEEMEQYQTKNT